VYIVLYLPETVDVAGLTDRASGTTDESGFQEKLGVALEYLPNTWNFDETFRVFRSDPFMTNLALIVFLYYTSVWALVSTLIIHVTRFLHFTPLALGWLLSGYGLATMFSEGVLVRVIVPIIGESNSMRLGLLSFSVQCILVAFSTSPLMIFISVLFSMVANLVYPSISSLVSKVVDERNQGEALGALNGIRALTEGFGPLVFGFLMVSAPTVRFIYDRESVNHEGEVFHVNLYLIPRQLFQALFENTPIPGAPYLLACFLSFWAFLHCFELPPEPELVIGKLASSDSEDDAESTSLLTRIELEN
jgi:MFS family permease